MSELKKYRELRDRIFPGWVPGTAATHHGQARLTGEGRLSAAGQVVDNSGQVTGSTNAAPTIAELMAATGIVPSKSAGRRAIAEGGAYLNNEKVTDVEARPGPRDLLHNRYLILRRGKRTIGAVEVVDPDDDLPADVREGG